jgi:hypothetical protein
LPEDSIVLGEGGELVVLVCHERDVPHGFFGLLLVAVLYFFDVDGSYLVDFAVLIGVLGDQPKFFFDAKSAWVDWLRLMLLVLIRLPSASIGVETMWKVKVAGVGVTVDQVGIIFHARPCM